MRRCFYHTDLKQNAVFHNFSRQIALTGLDFMKLEIKKNKYNNYSGLPFEMQLPKAIK